MRIWPDTLPIAIGPGYRLSPFDPMIRTDMESGPRRSRRQTLARHDSVSATFKLTDAQMHAFRAWHADEAWSLAGDSESLSAWSPTNASLSAGTVGPNGQSLQWRLIPNTVNGVHRASLALPDLAIDGAPVRLIASLRGPEIGWARVEFVDRAGVLASAVINLSTGALGAVAGVSAVSIVDRGTGWWRLSLSTSTGTGAAVPVMRLTALSAAGGLNWIGDGVSALGVCEINARIPNGFDMYLPTDAAGLAQGAAGGGAWFLMPLAFGGGLQMVEARFDGVWSADVLPGLGWMVSASMEVRNA